MGGGSVAALSAALAAALLEKLTAAPHARGRLQAIRWACLALIERDAEAFARVVQASRTNDRAAFRRYLRRATEAPCRVAEHAETIRAACRASRRSVKALLQSDLRCAEALAGAAAASARALVQANLAWLDDAAYSKRTRDRLRAVVRLADGVPRGEPR